LTCTKLTLVEKISDELTLSPNIARDAVENLLEIMKSTMESGEDIMVSGFGKFEVKEKAPRKGRNPSTDEPMTLPARRVVTFKCSGQLRDKVNGLI